MSTAGELPRVALLHPFHPDEVRRGTERLVEELSRGLVADGWPVELITTHRGRRSRTVEDGLTVVRNRRPPAILPADRRHHLSHIPASARALRRGHYGIAHALHPSDALAAVNWTRRSGRPTIFTVPAFPPSDAGRLRLATLRRIFSGADAIVVPTDAVGESIRARFPGARVTKIPPGVDLARFAPGGEPAPLPTVFSAAAIEEPRKRVELVARAFALLRGELPEARLVLANPYPARTEFPVWAREPGIEIRTIDDDVALVAAYREAHVSVLAATEEPFGLVIAESLACGTPVVGARDGGIPEIVDREEIGALFEGDDPAGLAAVLRAGLELAGDPETAARCRARAEEFSVERCVGAYERLYVKLLARPNGADPAPASAHLRL